MVLFPPCKINVGLRILRKRADGYHDLESIFLPIPVRDALEVLPAPVFSFSVSGLDIPGDVESNLCIRAYRLLQQDFPDLPTVQIYLHKRVPMGGGLGGGSADGAYMLRLLNHLFNLRLNPEALHTYAAVLGSDCPFFVQDKPCLAEGRGERLTPVDLHLSGYSLVLVHPGIHVNTSWAFSKTTPAPGNAGALTFAISGGLPPVRHWEGLFRNDFETPVFEAYPAIRALKEALYAAGAEFASMTGSGSAVYGLFPGGKVPQLSFPETYWKQNCNL